MGLYNARPYTVTNQLHLTSTSKYFPAAVLPCLSPLSDGGDQQIQLHKDRADRASPLMRWDKRGLSGRAVRQRARVSLCQRDRQGIQHQAAAGSTVNLLGSPFCA